MKRLKKRIDGIILAAVLLCCCACRERAGRFEYVDEPRQIPILAHTAPSQFNGVQTSAIGLVDTTLMVVNNSGNAVLSFYALSDLAKIADFGNANDKQGTLLRPKYSNQFFSEAGKVEFYIADTKRHSLQRYALADVLADGNARPLWQTYLPPAIASSYVSIFVAPDSTLLGNQFGDGKGRGRFFRYDMESDKISWTPYYPKSDLVIPDKDLSNYYYSQCAYDQSSGSMLSAMYHFKRLDVINTSNMASKAMIFRREKDEVPSYQPTGERNNPKRYYSFVFGASKYFYAYCINAHLSDYLGNVGNMEVHVFTWEGGLKGVFKLDRMHLGRFVVDEKKEKLYAVNYGQDKDEHPILSYDLKPIQL